MATINTRIVLRNDTTANWNANSTVVLRAGEAGVEKCDDGSTKMKIGNGVATWAELPYVGGDSLKLAQHYDVDPINGQTDIEAIDAVVSTEVQDGDIAIVRRNIDADGQKISRTAYVYDDGVWQALDGNYNAENVYFAEDFIYTAPIGVKTVPASGSGTIAATGKNVKEVLASILAQEKNPNKTNPSCTVTMTGGGEAEVGTVKTIGYTTTFNKGSYTYGPDTGIAAQSYSATFNGETLTTATGTFTNYTVPEGSKNISLTVTYNEGAIPKTNLGNPYEAGKIAAGSCSAQSGTVSGYRNMFYGAVTTDAVIDSALIRSLAGKKKTATGNLPQINAVAGAKKVIVAVPAARRVSKVLMPSAMNADATANFVLQDGTVNVEGANGFSATAYKVYVYQPAAIDPSETYLVTIA